jgi:hypothetical protein
VSGEELMVAVGVAVVVAVAEAGGREDLEENLSAADLER